MNRLQQSQHQSNQGPLDGVRVLEYGIFHAGPGASAILGDLGADVIKIESGDGDPERFWNKVGDLDFSLPNGENLMFLASNRNKRGIYLDVKSEKGHDIFHRLIKETDVFLTNLRKTTKEKMGLDYEAISRLNPRIIHANVSGYGPEGPMNDLGAFDPLGQARSGMMFVTGTTEPVLMHIAILDQATAIAASHAILTALYARERSGIGQEVHISLYGTGLWLTYPSLFISNALSINPVVSGNHFDHSPLRNFFRCKDGKWIIGTNHPSEKYWPAFCRATEQEDLLVDSRYADQGAREINRRDLVAHFDKVFATRTRDEWLEILLSKRLMFTAVQYVSEIESDPQALANGYVVDFEDPRIGKVKIPGYPIRFSKQRAGTRRLGPKIGEHTKMILQEIGYDHGEIEEFKKAGVVR